MGTNTFIYNNTTTIMMMIHSIIFIIVLLFIFTSQAFDHRVGTNKKIAKKDSDVVDDDTKASTKSSSTTTTKPSILNAAKKTTTNSKSSRSKAAKRPDTIEPVILQHSLDGVNFHAFARVSSKPRSLNPSIEMLENTSNQLLNDFKTTKQAWRDARYFVRLEPISDDVMSQSLSSVSACVYWAKVTSSKLTLHATLNGTVYHVDTSLPSAAQTLHLTCSNTPVAAVFAQQPRVTYNLGQFAESARVAEYQKLVEKKKVEESKEDNRHFVIKYWYVFLPLVVLLLTGGAAPEEEGAPAGAAATGGAAQGAAQ